MKDISMEMSELSKMLSDSKYDESLDAGKKFQIPMNTVSGLAEKLRDALESGNLQDALEAAKNLLEQIKKTRRVLEEYSDFAASMENNGEKMDELLKVKEQTYFSIALEAACASSGTLLNSVSLNKYSS